MGENRKRLDDLLRRRRRVNRVSAAVAAWTALGVTASPLSNDRHEKLLSLLRSAGIRRSAELRPSTVPLSDVVSEFSQRGDMLVIIGWDVDEEPGLLVSSDAVCQSVDHLRAIYPDGFVLLDQPLASAMLIDFDAEDPVTLYVEEGSLGRPT